MAHAQDKAVVVAELENYLKGVAKHFIERVYGPDGMPWGTRFGDLEDIAVELGQIVSRNMIEQAVARQAAPVPAEAEVCSGCGQPVTPRSDTEPRAVSTQVGMARWEEPKRYCPKCRAAFFPSVPGVGD
jgi:NADH pyrophosphatase NudC (nudix superfamily)